MTMNRPNGIVGIPYGDGWYGFPWAGDMRPTVYGPWWWKSRDIISGAVKYATIRAMTEQRSILYSDETAEPLRWSWVWLYSDNGIMSILVSKHDEWYPVAAIHLDRAEPDWAEIERRAEQI